ncbi:hypothetical protein M885DRAFT_612643 [Pelagophyceae sp. CCMP2097]|nr:hypothetical protein M885DRAFT_612643 [Pelagophyceae sp. CCMP2097]
MRRRGACGECAPNRRRDSPAPPESRTEATRVASLAQAALNAYVRGSRPGPSNDEEDLEVPQFAADGDYVVCRQCTWRRRWPLPMDSDWDAGEMFLAVEDLATDHDVFGDDENGPGELRRGCCAVCEAILAGATALASAAPRADAGTTVAWCCRRRDYDDFDGAASPRRKKPRASPRADDAAARGAYDAPFGAGDGSEEFPFEILRVVRPAKNGNAANHQNGGANGASHESHGSSPLLSDELDRLRAELAVAEAKTRPTSEKLLAQLRAELRPPRRESAADREVLARYCVLVEAQEAARAADRQHDAEDALDANCAVCGSGDVVFGNQILFCDDCNMPVHQGCYGVVHIPDGDWRCLQCSLLPKFAALYPPPKTPHTPASGEPRPTTPAQ